MDAARAQQGRRDHQACATTALQANIKDPREQPSAWIAPGERCLVVLVLPRAPIAPLEGISPARDRPHAPSALLDSVMRAQPRASVAVPASIQPLEAAARTAWLVGTVLRSQHRASAAWLVSTVTRAQPRASVAVAASMHLHRAAGYHSDQAVAGARRKARAGKHFWHCGLHLTPAWY
jgi:hypothetical protein